MIVNHLLVRKKSNKLLRKKNKELVHANLELIKAKQKAEESDKVKSAFLANMSHEIRTPLNAIIGFSTIMSKPNISEKENMEFTSVISQSSSNLLSLINDIIDIAKIHAGEIKINNDDIDIHEEIEFIYSFYKEEIRKEEKQDKIEFLLEKPDDKKLILNTDGSKVRQILFSLLSNAVKFTEQGAIVLSYKKVVLDEKTANAKNDSFEFVEFCVKDSGIGIDDDKISYVFDTFRKANEHKKKLYRGTGLGLAISKHLVELLGGEIWVESTVGVGSIFRFTIPYSSLAKSSFSLNKKKNELTFKNKTVLIVEDEQYNFMFVKTLLLQHFEFDIIWAQNGQEAIDIFNEKQFIDLIILDIKLPSVNGFKVIEHIKNQNDKIPIIVQTAYTLPEDKEKILESGGNEYISKPVDPDKLLSLVYKWLK